ncbi:nitroreductase family protein [Robinsoniella peoriensis]|uniref:nitroreductase family protein n=1 Tax=Robinsoniella peoriensis TaxID=180332 RepID=UPI003644E464
MLKAIVDRRSIRKYKAKNVPKSMIEEIIKAGTLAPSSKNRQPWEFIVVTGTSKINMLETMRKGLEREKVNPLLSGSVRCLSGAEYTLDIMQQAPIVIFIVNPLGIDICRSLTAEERIYEICNAQSIGAAIENMTLTATEFGLGSLWICDTYFAYKELCDWLHTDGELFAAMAIGYAEEIPFARPRKKINDVVEWRD